MALPSSLSSLSVREAITDALYRCLSGIDTNDAALFDSAFIQDSSLDLNGNVFDDFKAIQAGCFDLVSKLDTTHFITNIRVDVKDGESTAAITANALAQHYREKQGMKPGATRFLAGSLYFIDCVKDDKEGLWKIKHWKVKLVWTEGDGGIMTGK